MASTGLRCASLKFYYQIRDEPDLDSSGKGNLHEVAPGKRIGGDKLGNDEGLLPQKAGRRIAPANSPQDNICTSSPQALPGRTDEHHSLHGGIRTAPFSAQAYGNGLSVRSLDGHVLCAWLHLRVPRKVCAKGERGE